MKVINRIKKNEDFGSVINKAKPNRLTSFVIYVMKTENGYTRVGISVSKKLGHAVVRNRIKRQVRAIFDTTMNYDAQSLDIVVIVKKEFLDNDFHNNKSQICDFMKGI